LLGGFCTVKVDAVPGSVPSVLVAPERTRQQANSR
jgi:hypothetical protein